MESIVLLSRKSSDCVINVTVEWGSERKMLLDAIAEVKRFVKLTMYDAFNAVEELKHSRNFLTMDRGRKRRENCDRMEEQWGK